MILPGWGLRRGFSVKKLVKSGASGARKRLFPARLDWRRARRMAGIAAAVSSVVAAGALSAMFVDHLADRAVMRAAAAAPAAAREAAVKSGADRAALALAQAKRPTPAAAGKAAPVALAAAASPQRAAVTALKPAKAGPAPSAAKETAPQAMTAVSQEAERKFEASAFAEVESATDSAAVAAIEATVPLPPSAPYPQPRADEAAAAKADGDSGRAARVTKHVNLRSGPNDESKIVAVVPARASVSVLDCKSWCEVVFDGKKGWIYKRFIRES
jgi:SH3-like domain-containing protein